MAYRIEKDTFGPIEVPADRLWGAQTQRSLQNFRISTEKMPPALIKALAEVKRAAAQVNLDLKVLDPKKVPGSWMGTCCVLRSYSLIRMVSRSFNFPTQ